MAVSIVDDCFLMSGYVHAILWIDEELSSSSSINGYYAWFNTLGRLRFEPSLGQILVNIHVHVMTFFSSNTVF
jgi:hypothetical protein